MPRKKRKSAMALAKRRDQVRHNMRKYRKRKAQAEDAEGTQSDSESFAYVPPSKRAQYGVSDSSSSSEREVENCMAARDTFQQSRHFQSLRETVQCRHSEDCQFPKDGHATEEESDVDAVCPMSDSDETVFSNKGK